MRQGLPLGTWTVSSPLLFLFYIDSIYKIIPDEVELALFADDTFVWSSDTDQNRANRRVQTALGIYQGFYSSAEGYTYKTQGLLA